MAIRLSADDVFINCPFDADYAPSFRALIFGILACGFQPRSAREVDDAGQTRIEKLFGIIAECRYGLHDLSRTELDASNGLPRFNMPLELGIFLGAKRYGGPAQKLKRVLILDIGQYRYQQFISDLAGMDIHAHAEIPKLLLPSPGTGSPTSRGASSLAAPSCAGFTAGSWPSCRRWPPSSNSSLRPSPMSISRGSWRAGWSRPPVPNAGLSR